MSGLQPTDPGPAQEQKAFLTNAHSPNSSEEDEEGVARFHNPLQPSSLSLSLSTIASTGDHLSRQQRLQAVIQASQQRRSLIVQDHSPSPSPSPLGFGGSTTSPSPFDDTNHSATEFNNMSASGYNVYGDEQSGRPLIPPRAPGMRNVSGSSMRKPWSHQGGGGTNSPYDSAKPFSSYSDSLKSQGTGASGGGAGAEYQGYDPSRWNLNIVEDDDDFHDPTKGMERSGHVGWRGVLNIGTLALLAIGILMLFMGYPLLIEFYYERVGNKGGYGIGGTNSSGQIPDLASMNLRQSLIDLETPAQAQFAYNKGRNRNEKWNLVFSDEFNVDGRSFYPGDDPFWEAVNLYGHGTGDYEWYDPAAITTRDGALVISLTQQDLHDLKYRSGQVTSWNQFCFTGGYLEASVILPGEPNVSGWWPAIWTMGNLGRANYAATTEGTWPYSYDTCDIGTLINQTNPDGLAPEVAITSGAESGFNGLYSTTMLSWQPGQRLSACTCDGEDHPGPKKKDGTYKGRSAPEIDLFEAQVNSGVGSLSLSTQFMPSNKGYRMANKTGTEVELADDINGQATYINPYHGSVLQMAASGVALTNTASYQLSQAQFSTWGVEYEPGPNGYVTWWIDGKMAWHLTAAAVAPDPLVGIGQRPIPEEPMYIIMNLALSGSFGTVQWGALQFPATMTVDYVRLYQAPDKINVGCDPPDFPTSDYINKHIEAYTNPNWTIWGGHRETGGYGQMWPRNRLYNNGKGCDEEPRNYPGRLRPLGETQAPADTVPEQYRGMYASTTTAASTTPLTGSTTSSSKKTKTSKTQKTSSDDTGDDTTDAGADTTTTKTDSNTDSNTNTDDSGDDTG